MILVDTSVIINLLRDRNDKKTQLFRQILEKGIPFGLSILMYQEILQGARDETEWNTLEEYLSTQVIYQLPDNIEFYKKSAKKIFDLRRRGVTPRSTIDVLIAYTAIENDIYLLHNDKDFDIMSQHTPELKTLDSI